MKETAMVDIYVRLIQAGRRSLSDVPQTLQQQIIEALEALKALEAGS